MLTREIETLEEKIKRIDLEMQYDFLVELRRILASKAAINDAVNARQSLKLDGKQCDLAAIDQYFDERGELQEISPVSVDARVAMETLHNDFGVCPETENLPLRERIIFDAAFGLASSNVALKYQAQQKATMSEMSNNVASGKMTKEIQERNNKLEKEFKSLNDLKDSAPKKVISQLGPLSMKTAYQVDPRVQSKIYKLQQEYRKEDAIILFDLVQHINALKNDYRELGRSKNAAALEKLISKVNNINSENTQAHEKLASITDAIEEAFAIEMKNYNKPILGFIGSTKKPEDFGKKLSDGSDAYHYPRLLGLTLQGLYKAQPDLKSRPEQDRIVAHERDQVIQAVDTIKVYKYAHHHVYAATLPLLVNDARYDLFAKTLKAADLRNLEIYKLYTEHHSLNVTLVKKLWPELKYFKLDDEEIRFFISNDRRGNIALARKIAEQPLNETAIRNFATQENNQTNKLGPTQRKLLFEKISAMHSKEGAMARLEEIKDAIAMITQRQFASGSSLEMQPRPPRQ